MSRHLEASTAMIAMGKVGRRGQVTLPASIRRAAGIQAGDKVTIEVTGDRVVEIRLLPRFTLAEALERFRIEGPVDLPRDRELWEAEAARDVLGRRDD